MESSRGYSWHAHAAIAGVVDDANCKQAVIRAWSQQKDRTSIAYRTLTIGAAFATALESAQFETSTG